MKVLSLIVVVASLGNGQAHVTKGSFANDGTPVQADLPLSMRMHNTGGIGRRGPGTGSGLCVFTSIEHSARYQTIPALYGLQEWMTRKPGGGWPEKVDEMIAQYCKERGIPIPRYIQVETTDLDILRKAMQSGRTVCITYGVSPTGNYRGKGIQHMVSLVAAGAGKGPDGKGWYAVCDNNFPDFYEWMSEAQFLRSFKGSQSYGWAIIFLDPCPAPIPYR